MICILPIVVSKHIMSSPSYQDIHKQVERRYRSVSFFIFRGLAFRDLLQEGFSRRPRFGAMSHIKGMIGPATNYH